MAEKSANYAATNGVESKTPFLIGVAGGTASGKDDKRSEQEEVSVYSALVSEPSTSQTDTDTSNDQMIVQATSEANQPGQAQKNSRIMKEYSSKSSQTHISKRDSMTSPPKVEKNIIFASPCKNMVPSRSGTIRKLGFTEAVVSECDFSNDSSIQDCSLASNSVNFTTDNISHEDKNEAEGKLDKKIYLQLKINHIKKKPLFYIGVQKSCYFLIDILKKHSGIPEKWIMLCFKKIKLNTIFEVLADDSGITKSHAIKIFHKNIPIIASLLSPFIVKLDREAIKLNLPIPFRHQYHEVLCIIDCLELEIEKPSKALHQAQTWSQYKEVYTIKYLISYTPNGLVNYVSPGYGGKITDIELLEKCNFLDTLPPNATILAGGVFKHLESLLIKRGFKVLRPSIPVDSNQIPSVSIHVEKVMRRVRSFNFLKPHEEVSKKLVHLLDEIVTIACALINLRDSIKVP